MSNDVLEAVRAFVADEVIGQERMLDSLAPAPLPIYRSFASAGLSNWWLAKEFGGQQLPLTDSVKIVNELSYGDAGVAFTLFIPVLTTSMLNWYGAPEVVGPWLSAMVERGGFAATLGSEHDAGSELGRTTTTATIEGDEIVLNGSKAFSTNTDFADVLVVIARSADSPTDFVAVMVPRDTAGITVERRWNVLGLRASGTYQIELTNVRVPAGNLLAGNGLRLLEIGLNASRILIATTAVGIARRARDLVLEYARGKQVKGAPLAGNPVFAGKLAQIEMQIDVMLHQCLAAAAEYDEIAEGPEPASEFLRVGAMRSALTAKMFSGQTGWQILSTISEMFGGLGYTDDTLIGKLMRDIRYVSIVEGGDDVLRELIYGRFVAPASKRI